MTIRDWCSHTNNVYYGATRFTICETGKLPVRAVAGNIPNDIAERDIDWISVTKVNPDTLAFWEVKVKVL